MRRTLERFSALAIGVPALLLMIPAGAQERAGGDVVEMPDLAGDPSHRDFGGAPEDVEVVTGDEEEVADPGDAPNLPGRKHVVEKGDTLWDLSERYLGSPWYWPKVWSFNPQIENPHWIYPGDEVRLGTGEAEAVAAAPGEPAPAPEDEIVEEDEVSVAGQIGFQGPTTIRVPAVGFATSEQLGSAGAIARSFEEKELLHEGDRVYLEMANRGAVRVGDRMVVFREEDAVQHPETGARLGSMVRILGAVRIVSADARQKYVTGVIERSILEITRGDRVGPAGVELSRQVDPVAPARDVSGIIAATLEEEIAELAQGHFVILDRGTRNGVTRGNTLDVIRASDGLEDDGLEARFDEDIPAESIGQVLVVDARESTSVAVVLRSLRELRRGDRVEMRTARATR
ncbi:MAG TPA: LysM peptidoglycan-binding domain-containing protein [Vulgatibacter sp.]|nr:LysM peptidoglycan-binding domain-containing protein [Vulgatibacter sp.]